MSECEKECATVCAFMLISLWMSCTGECGRGNKRERRVLISRDRSKDTLTLPDRGPLGDRVLLSFYLLLEQINTLCTRRLELEAVFIHKLETVFIHNI
jgi:hypothetical protein